MADAPSWVDAASALAPILGPGGVLVILLRHLGIKDAAKTDGRPEVPQAPVVAIGSGLVDERMRARHVAALERIADVCEGLCGRIDGLINRLDHGTVRAGELSGDLKSELRAIKEAFDRTRFRDP